MDEIFNNMEIIIYVFVEITQYSLYSFDLACIG